MNPEEKKKAIKKVKFWWHTIDFGDEIFSPGLMGTDAHNVLASSIPDNLKGKTVLDIGTRDGYYAFECEKRGAKEILATDITTKTGFSTAKDILNSKVRFEQIDIYDLPDDKYDVVLFLGVLYHLKYPLKALELLYSITNELLILESHIINTNLDEPMMKFYPGDDLNNDSSNWWGPNPKCIIEMLKVAGFKKAEIHSGGTETDDRVIIKAYK